MIDLAEIAVDVIYIFLLFQQKVAIHSNMHVRLLILMLYLDKQA